MSICVVHESLFGNTAEVARAVARGLGDAQVRDVVSTTASDVEGFDLVVLGGPTHAFSMTRRSTREDARRQGASEGAVDRGLRELVVELPRDATTRFATFDTRVSKVRRLPGSAARAAAKELLHHHHTKVLDQESFYVADVAGPLLDGELDRAQEWGARLLEKL